MRNIFHDNLFTEALIDNLIIETNLILEELLHIGYVINFFSTGTESKKYNLFYRLQNPDTSLRFLFSNLIVPFQELVNKVEVFYEEVKELKELKEDLINYSVDEEKNRKNYDLCAKNFFGKFIFIQSKKRTILDLMDYMQKKLINMIESFPGYYPSPKEASSKGATKIHLYMELFSGEFKFLLEQLKNKTDKDKNENIVCFYWDFLPEVRYILKADNLFINTDFFLPKRQSHWLILCHEVLHYILYNAINKEKLENNNFFDSILYYIKKMTGTIDLVLYSLKIKSDIDENSLTDIFIDSLLTYILGLPYFLPITVRLFAFDEENFWLPSSAKRKWFLRLMTALNFYKSSKQKNIDQQFAKDFEEILNLYRKLQISTGTINPFLYRKEEAISSIISEFLNRFFKKERASLEQLKNIFQEQKEANKWTYSYLKYASKYFEYYLNKLKSKNSENKKGKNNKNISEGRALCRIFGDILYFQESNINREYIKKLIEMPVYKFQYFKVRYDKVKKRSNKSYPCVLEKLQSLRTLCAWSFGPYTFLSFDIFPYNEKYNRMENSDEYLQALENLISNDDINFRNAKSPEIELLSNHFLFYKEDLSLTLYDYDLENKEKLDNPLEIIRTPCDKIYLFIKYQICRDKQIKFEDIKQLFMDYREEISKYQICRIDIFHFISFDWFDFCTLITFRPKNIPNNKIDLMGILKILKEKVLINNQGKLRRTETDIFIGKNITDKVKIRLPYIHLRVSSNELGKTKNIIESIKRKDLISGWKISSRFGIRDLVLSPPTSAAFTFEKILDVLKSVTEEGIFSDFQFVVSVDH